ncbi:cytosolic beta-glucosidase-like [Branchiostoma lanceolatum]|uniref:cytosolic beta-glucosidase-like n=1 Tax=Branchiostoma lanceolatum TaxID=7740 RepID=UPI0034520E2E
MVAFYGTIFMLVVLGHKTEGQFLDLKNMTVRDTFLSGTLPDGFLWGTATAAFQIEGGWDSGEKGPSIWDWFSHLPGNVPWGDVAADSYHKYKEDVQMHVDTGLNSYRFSISWPRLFPDGTNTTINQYGVDYYNNLINELKNNGIEPLVTLYHWDLPQKLKDRYGGWVNDTMVELFENYARFCFATFGDRVKYWATFNEPWSFVAALGDFNHDPDYSMRYKMAHNVIRAHARAWHTYDDDFRSSQNGSVGIVISSMWGEPADLHNPADRQAATNYMEFFFGWFANPIIGNGDYPDVMKRMVRESRLKQNQTVSPLPEFTEEEKLYNSGSTDFLGINTYTARIISATNETQTCHPDGHNFASACGFMPDLMGVKETVGPGWFYMGSNIFWFAPWNIRGILHFVRERYNYTKPFYLSEVGIGETYKYHSPPNLNDTWRMCFYMTYANEALKAVKLDGVDLRGFYAWTLLDNVEWGSGPDQAFGLYHTNFTHPSRQRTPKRSQGLYRTIARENGFPENANHVWMTQEWWQWCHMEEAYAPTRPDYVEPTSGARPTQPAPNPPVSTAPTGQSLMTTGILGVLVVLVAICSP